MTKCKGCGKMVLAGSWCHACYNEYHETNEELASSEEREACEEVEDGD